MRFVLDASVALAWFLPDEDPQVARYAAAVLAHVRDELDYAVVPLTWHEEIAAKLLQRLRARRLTQEAFDAAEEFYHRMPLETHMNAYTTRIIIERARRYHLQGFDAIYFDLAVALELPIATLDRGIKSASARFGVTLFEPGG